MDNFLVIVFVLFCLACMGGMYYNFTRIIKQLKKQSPDGTITQDAAFIAFAELLTESIPEFVAGYQSILVEASTDETKMKVVIDTIVNDVLEYIENEKYGNARLEAISKLLFMVPIDMVKITVANAATEFINKYLSSEKEKEAKISSIIAD